MRIKLTNTGSDSDMKKHYQTLLREGYGAIVSKETRTIKGKRPGWDIEENSYEIVIGSEMDSRFFFDLSDVLGEELIVTRENGQLTIEIYDNWRE